MRINWGGISALFDFKKAYGTLGARICTVNILIQISIPMKIESLIKVRLNKTFSRIVKHLSDTFPICNGLKIGYVLFPLLFKHALEYVIRRLK
jgi:hypothetical protein